MSNYNYTIEHLEDVSTPRVKRYSAWVVLGERYPQDEARSIITAATDEVKVSTYYKSDNNRNRYGNSHAQAVWLYVASDMDKANRGEWVCRTQWIDPALTEYRPVEISGERVNGINVLWYE